MQIGHQLLPRVHENLQMCTKSHCQRGECKMTLSNTIVESGPADEKHKSTSEAQINKSKLR
jgi:hypothetical protein